MSPFVHHLEARVPWGNGGKPAVPPKDEAPRRPEVFRCAKGHEFTLVFAAGAEAPDGWDCRHCGRPARREGAPDGPAASPELPGLRSGTGRHGQPRDGTDVTPMGQLRKRRTEEQGSTILGEAQERARQARGAQ